MNKINFFTELVNRWNQKSPIFFVKLRSFGIALAALSGTLVGITEMNIPGFTPSEIIGQVAGYLTTAGAFIAIVSKFTVKDPDYKTLDQKLPIDPNKIPDVE